MYRITLDVGTTNLRVVLWHNVKVIHSLSAEVGVRNTAIDGHNKQLKSALNKYILKLLDINNLDIGNIEAIIASGMITSNVGFVDIPHLETPSGIQELAQNMIACKVPEIINKEIWFIPGVKNDIKSVTYVNASEMDTMRGEEVEVIALIKGMKIENDALLILPGSHTKFIRIDKNKRITSCATSLAGELLSGITNHTILAGSLKKKFPEEIEKEFLIQGYKDSNENGLNKALFNIRILDLFGTYSVNQLSNYLLGIILEGDVQLLKNSKNLNAKSANQLIVGGKSILKTALYELLLFEEHFHDIIMVDDVQLKNLAGFGALCVAAERGIIQKVELNKC